MDMPGIAERVVVSEFCTAARDTRVARFDPLSQEADPGAVSGEESYSEGAGGCECKDIISFVRHIRCQWQPDDRGDHGGQAQRVGDRGFSERYADSAEIGHL